MKVGDLVQIKEGSYDRAPPDFVSLTGIVVNMRIEWPDAEILWSDGIVDEIDVRDVKVINEG